MKKSVVCILIFIIILLLISSCSATTKKGIFGNELRFETNGYSVAELDGLDAHPKEDTWDDIKVDMFYSSEGYINPIYYVYRVNPEDIGLDEKGNNMFASNYTTTAGFFPHLAHPRITILKNYTKNGLNMYFIKKTEDSVVGNDIYNYYYMYGVGEKEGYTYCILDDGSYFQNHDDEEEIERLYSSTEESFLDIFNSIEKSD